MNVLSLSERLRKETASLGRRKKREENKYFLIEGVRSVEAAVVGGAQLVRLIISDRIAGDERVLKLLDSTETPVYSMTDKQEKSMSTVDTSPGLIAVARYKEDALEDYLEKKAILVLDGVQDPGNVGTIIRSAAWFGIDAVLLGTGTADVYHPKTVRSTMGGLWDTGCVRLEDTVDALHQLKSMEFTLYGAFMDGEPLSQWQPVEKTAIIIGSESRGISDAIQPLIDARISIPSGGQGAATESLNAATAAAICMYAYASSSPKIIQTG